MQKLSLNVNISQLKSDMMSFHPSIHPLLRPLIICKVSESIQANTVRVAGYASLVPRITKYQNGSLALAVGGSFLGITLKVTRCWFKVELFLPLASMSTGTGTAGTSKLESREEASAFYQSPGTSCTAVSLFPCHGQLACGCWPPHSRICSLRPTLECEKPLFIQAVCCGLGVAWCHSFFFFPRRPHHLMTLFFFS